MIKKIIFSLLNLCCQFSLHHRSVRVIGRKNVKFILSRIFNQSNTTGNCLDFRTPEALVYRTDICFKGNDNRVLISGTLRNCWIRIEGVGNQLILEDETTFLHTTFLIHGNNCIMKIGRKTTSGIPNRFILMGNGKKLTIGESCMFSDYVEVWAADAHPIFDRDSNQLLNIPRSTTIGNHVWLGLRATVLKGVTIGDGAIVGANTTLSRDVPSHTIVAGNPPRILRNNVDWECCFLEESMGCQTAIPSKY